MPIRREKITTYSQAFGLIHVSMTGKAMILVKDMERQGHSEKSICFAIWKSKDKLCDFRNDSRFESIFINEIRKWSWPNGDPRWKEFHKKKEEEQKAVELDKIEEQKRAQEYAYAKRYPGFIYFIQGESGGAVKIGYATDISKRIKTLQTGFPETLIIVKSFPGNMKDEEDIHTEFNGHHLRGEWFNAEVLESAVMVVDVIQKERPKVCTECGGTLIAIRNGMGVIGHACIVCGFLAEHRMGQASV
jgi:hypothetical protein